MNNKIIRLKNCKTRIDFLNLLFPHESGKEAYLKVIFGIPDNEKYIKFEIPKKSGGKREILAPNRELKKIQTRLATLLSECYMELYSETNRYSNGFLKGKSIVTNAQRHKNKKYVLNTDLENFFSSFTFGRVRNYFIKNKHFELNEEVATIIAKIACCNGKLPQGSPSSPIITNFICQIMDYRLGKLAKKNLCHYSRYADDLTFSTNLSKFPEELAYWHDNHIFLTKKFEQEISKAGFSINENKTRLLDKRVHQEVTGLTVNSKVNVSRKYFDDTKAMARKYYMTGTCNINGKEGTAQQILGRFNFINQVEKYNNKLLFKRNEKNNPKNIFFNPGEKSSETNQVEQRGIRTQVHNKSIYHKPEIDWKIGYHYLSARERAYSKFLYYSKFIINDKPIILTEGKTDVLYLKAALKKLYLAYPDLVEIRDNKFFMKVQFYNYSKLNRYLLNIYPSGRGILRVLNPKYIFPENSKISKRPVILLLDNEPNKKYPLGEFLTKKENSKKEIEGQNFLAINSENIAENHLSKELFEKLSNPKFYLLVIPKNQNEEKADIETLFESDFLENRAFNKNKKDELSKYVLENYKQINFDGFKPLLDNLTKIVKLAQ